MSVASGLLNFGGVCLTSGVVTAVVQQLMSRGQVKRVEAREDRDDWREEFRENYDTLKDRAEQNSEDLERANKKIDRIESAFNGLLEDLEDQIVPMLSLNADPAQTKKAMRSVVRKARDRARELPIYGSKE